MRVPGLRVVRHLVAGAFLVLVTSGTAAAATINPGAGGSPIQAIGGNVATITTYVHDASDQNVTSVPVGMTVHPYVVVSGVSGTPSGTVHITFWTNGTCSGTGGSLFSGPLVNGSVDPVNADYPTTTSGALSYRTHYLGDGVYPPGDSNCAAVTVVKVTPTITLAMRDASGNAVTTAYIGTTLHAFVRVNGSITWPTGNVQVYGWIGSVCSGTAAVAGPYALVNGQVDTSFAWPMTTVGTQSFRVAYYGDGKYGAAVSPCLTVTIRKYPVDFTTQMFNQYGDPVDDHAMVGTEMHVRATLSGDGGAPTGQIQFRHYQADNCDGAADQAASFPAVPILDPAGPAIQGGKPGGASWQLEYMGDAKHAAAMGPCMTITFMAGPLVITSVRDASDALVTTTIAGRAVHPSVNVSGGFGTPTGQVSVKWYANGWCGGTGTTLGKRTLSNGAIDDATLKLVPSKAGSYSFMASYSGDAAYIGDSSPCAVLKVVAAPVVTPKPTAVAPGATSKPDPTGAVAAATSAPDPTASASAAPVASAQPTPSDAPASTGPSGAGEASAGPGSEGAGSAGAGSGAGATTPTSPSSDAGFAWIALLLLILILLAAFAIWARMRMAGQRRRSAEVAR